jgi:phospholipid/cholesterol/gamma-HCH transport system ATP-binding protein
MAAEPYISYRNVYKAFGKQQVCRDFSLDIARGETLCIIGPSGIGKTVTIKMLIGLIWPDSGQIVFDGQDVASFVKDEDFLPIRRRIAMVFQGSALFDSMSVFDNVAYALREQKKLTEQQIADVVMERLDWVGLAESAEKMPGELSGGMKKRVGLARAIATDPEVILYDEPTAGLDPINTTRIGDVIADLGKRMKATSLVVTHDIPVSKRLSDRAAFMYDGKIKAIGKIESLERSEDKFVRGFLQGNPELAE